MCGAAALSSWLKPNHYAAPLAASLDTLIPRNFGGWHEINRGPVAINPSLERGDGDPNVNSPYDDVLLRSYQNADGAIMQLAVAYGRRQLQEVKIHRPELCYTAQGFLVRSIGSARFSNLAGREWAIDGAHMLVEAPGRIEAVSYWIRIGEFYSPSSWLIRLHIFTEGVKGRVDDGVLVRASQIVSGSDAAIDSSYALQARFLSALVEALPPTARELLSS
jgi:EpsI family protein